MDPLTGPSFTDLVGQVGDLLPDGSKLVVSRKLFFCQTVFNAIIYNFFSHYITSILMKFMSAKTKKVSTHYINVVTAQNVPILSDVNNSDLCLNNSEQLENKNIELKQRIVNNN